MDLNYSTVNIFPVPIHQFDVNGFSEIQNELIDYVHKMREKDPYIYDIPESNLCWLHNCGSAAKSTLQWLKRDYGGLRKMDETELKRLSQGYEMTLL